MNYIKKYAALVFCTALLLTGTLEAQETTTYTNRQGDTVTDTRSLQNGQYTNDRTVTAPNGNTRTNDYTASRNSNGRVVTSDTHTGPTHGGNPWLLVCAAIAGSVLGGYTSWQIGRKGGRATLRRHVPARFLEPLCEWVGSHPILAVFLPATLPPPAPLTTFVLASGALGVSRRRFLMAFGAARSLRYALVAWLGVTYGRHVVRFWSATIQKWSAPLLWAFVAMVAGGVGYGLWQTHTRNRSSAPKDPPIDAVACLPD